MTFAVSVLSYLLISSSLQIGIFRLFVTYAVRPLEPALWGSSGLRSVPVCVSVCLYISVFVCVSVCLYISVFVCVSVCLYISVFVCVSVLICVSICICVGVWVYKCLLYFPTFLYFLFDLFISINGVFDIIRKSWNQLNPSIRNQLWRYF